jgi:DNA-binding response OmpR family regulator
MDVNMDGGEGWMLLRVLRGDMSTAHIPIIVTSAHGDIMGILAAGAKAVLKKPVHHDELAGALKRVGACPRKFVVAVDEDPKTLDMYERLLSPQGFHVVRCSSAARVDKVVENTNPALVIMNWMTVLASGDKIDRNHIPVVGVAPHALSPRVRAEVRGRLPIDLVASDGSRPSFRAHLGNAIRAAAVTAKPPSAS